MRDFLWANNETSSGFCWVNWREVCCSKQEGGLGIRPLRRMKTKWLWHFIKEENALWRNVIIGKYGVDILGWWTKKSTFAHGIGFWKSILPGLQCFKSSVHFEVKNRGPVCVSGMMFGGGINIFRYNFQTFLGWRF